MIALIPYDLPFACDGQDGAPVIVALPVRVGDIVTKTSAPGLTGINTGRDRHAVPVCDDKGIGAAKGAIEKPAVIGDIVHGCQDNGSGACFLHNTAQASHARLIFRDFKGKWCFFTIVKAIHFRTCSHSDPPNQRKIPAFRTVGI